MNTEYDTPFSVACARKFYELMKTEPRQPGYSYDHLLSVMVVVGCDAEKAMRLIDGLTEFGAPDWSEDSWEELKGHFTSLQYFLGE